MGISLELRCAKCGEPLEGSLDGLRNAIMVESCKECIEEAMEIGAHEAREEFNDRL